MTDEDTNPPGDKDAKAADAVSDHEREARLVRAMGESLGVEVSPEKALAQLERRGKARGREDGISAARMAIYMIAAVMLAIPALWFSNEMSL